MTGGPVSPSGGGAEEGVTGERLAPVQPLNPRRRRRTRRHILAEWPLTLVILVVAGGLALVAFASFRLGTVVIALGVLLGFVLRLTLSEQAVGMLAVRSRILDLAILGVIGVMLAVLAFIVPAPN
jgi:hypothetical protein